MIAQWLAPKTNFTNRGKVMNNSLADHHLGISFITIAFVYALYISLKTNKALMPSMFYVLYGIGGTLIFVEMFGQQKAFVYYAELIGFLIAFYLAYHSYRRRKLNVLTPASGAGHHPSHR